MYMGEQSSVYSNLKPTQMAIPNTGYIHALHKDAVSGQVH
jgi:hypothetical protein